MSNCPFYSSTWMSTMRFKLSMSKIEFLIVTPKPTFIPMSAVACLPCQLLKPKPHATNPLSFIPHGRSVNSHQLLFRIRPECDITSAVTILVQTTILSYLSYHHVLLLGLPDSALDFLECVPNIAAGGTENGHGLPGGPSGRADDS